MTHFLCLLAVAGFHTLAGSIFRMPIWMTLRISGVAAVITMTGYLVRICGWHLWGATNWGINLHRGHRHSVRDQQGFQRL